MPVRFWVLSILCSILPDADVAGFFLGVRYGDLFGHRGFSHSLLFALIVAFVIALAAFRDVRRFSGRWWALVGHFFVVTASHGIVDAMTSGGLGIGFFIPFDDTRYFLPWRPIRVSAIRLDSFFSSPRTLDVLRSEFLWVWLPLLGIVAAAAQGRTMTRPAAPPVLPESGGNRPDRR